MALATMYNGQANSPQTTLNGGINSSVTSITVTDGTILPTAPMPLVISEGTKEPETVLMTNKVGNVLTVTRAFQGVAQSWSDGVSIGRNFTAYDYNTLVENATTINNDLTTHKAESATQAHLAKNIGLEDTTGNFTATELEGAMSELFTNVSNGKNSIASSITGKGVSASGSDSFSVLSTKINNIVTDPSGSTTATVGDLLSGKTAYSKGVKLTGTMPNRGAYNITPGSSNKAIPSGYHSGGGVVYGDADLVSANIKAGKNIFGVAGNSNVVDTSAGTAVAADIYPGKKAYVDGSLITGTMATKSAQTFTPKTTNQTIASGSYLTGTQTIAGDANLVAGNIASGKNIFGVVGNMPQVYVGAIDERFSSRHLKCDCPFLPKQVFAFLYSSGDLVSCIVYDANISTSEWTCTYYGSSSDNEIVVRRVDYLNGYVDATGAKFYYVQSDTYLMDLTWYAISY